MPIKYNIIKNKNIYIDNTIVEYDHNSIIVGFAIPKNFNGIDMANKNVFIKFLNDKYYNGIIKCERIKQPSNDNILNLEDFKDKQNEFYFYQWIVDQTQTKLEGKLKIALEINQVMSLAEPTVEQIQLMKNSTAGRYLIAENAGNTQISIYYTKNNQDSSITVEVNGQKYQYYFKNDNLSTYTWLTVISEVYSPYTGLFPITSEELSKLTIYDSYNLNNLPSYLEQIIKSFGAYDRDYFRWSSLPFEITINKTIETLENFLDMSNFIDLINEQYKYYPNTLTKVNVIAGDYADGSIEIDNKTHAMTLNLTLPRGEKGDKGEQGIQGQTGSKGEQGPKGDAFTYKDFTPEQLLSLKGEKGEQGPRGEKGDKGEQGSNYILTEEDKQNIANIVKTECIDELEQIIDNSGVIVK